MRNRLDQPLPLDLPPVEMPPIRVYGQLIGPMQRAGAGVKILLRAISTNQLIVQDTWSESTTDSAGNYDFSLVPGKYAVFFERNGVKDRVQNIQIYSDSAPGNLQSFMLAPAPELLTPLVVLEARAILESTSAAMLRARQWAENPVDVPVLDFEQGAGPEYSAYHWAHKTWEYINTDTNINWRGEWASGTAYAFRDAVRWRPDENTAYSSYYCTEANTGHAPPTISVGDNEFWSLMAAGGERGADSTVPGPPNQLGIGSVEAVPYGTAPSATITGSYPDQKLNLKLETGKEGQPGTSPDMSNYYTKNQIDAMLSGGGGSTDYASVGSVIFAGDNVRQAAGGGWDPGSTIAGSRLSPAGVIDDGSEGSNSLATLGIQYMGSLPGTWRAMGYAMTVGNSFDGNAVSVFVRIA